MMAATVILKFKIHPYIKIQNTLFFMLFNCSVMLLKSNHYITFLNMKQINFFTHHTCGTLLPTSSLWYSDVITVNFANFRSDCLYRYIQTLTPRYTLGPQPGLPSVHLDWHESLWSQVEGGCVPAQCVLRWPLHCHWEGAVLQDCCDNKRSIFGYLFNGDWLRIKLN